MKNYSKMVALFLALIMAVVPGVASANTEVSVTTGSGAALGSSIDLEEKVLNVNFTGEVDENKLADGVKVYENASTEKVLHIERKEAGSVDYATLVKFEPTTVFDSGKLTLSFSYKWTGDRYPVIYFYRTDGTGSRSNVLEKILIDDAGWKKMSRKTDLSMSSTNTLPSGTANTKGRWVDFEIEFDLDRAAGPAYDFSIDGNALGSLLGCNHYDAAGSKDISKIVIGPDENSGAVADLSIKNFKVTHVASGATTVYSPNYSKAPGETGFDFVYGASLSNGIATATIEDALTGTVVDMDASYNDGTYTLTKADNWDTTKTYTLWVSKNINGAAADSIYNFTATDLGGIKAVTVDDAELGEEIDLTQKEIKIEFAKDVTESALADGVKVMTDVANEKVFHMTAASDAGQYGVRLQKNLSSAYTSGTVTFNYSFKYLGNRYPETYIRTSSGAYLEGFRVYSDSKGNNKYMISYKETGDHTMSDITTNVKGRWVDVEVIVDLDASPKCYTFKVDGVTVRENEQFKTGVEVTDIGQLLFMGGQNASGAVDVMWKDIKITHKASESVAPTVIEAAGTDFFTSTNACTVTEEEVMNGVYVEMDRSYDEASKTYTLTNNGDWDAAKEYKLVIDKDVIGAAEDAEYDFVARNLFGSLTLNGITTSSGAALTNGGYLSVAEEGIKLEFSDAVKTSSLSGIKLEKSTADKVLHMNGGADTGAYAMFMRRVETTAYTTGTLTINYSVKYTDNRYPTLYVRSGSNYLEGFRIDGEKYNLFKKSSQFLPMPSGIENTVDRWTDVEVSVDLSSNPKTYTFKVDGVAVVENEEFATGVTVDKIDQFIFYAEEVSGAVDIMWKDIKITHKASESATPTVKEANITAGVLPDFFTAYSSDISAASAKELETLTSVDVEYANDTTTNTVVVIPETALEYLATYKLTVPATIESDGGAQLLAGDVINFTAIYDDALYSGAAGFKAGGVEVSEISSTFTGDITGWADITNVSGSPKNATLIVALYQNDVLVDIDVVPVTNIGEGETKTDACGTVTIAADKAGAGYRTAVFVLNSLSELYPVANKTTTK